MPVIVDASLAVRWVMSGPFDGEARELLHNWHRERAAPEEASSPEDQRRVEILQRIFLDHLPPAVIQELQEVRRMELTGLPLVHRLEARRARHRLNPADTDASETAQPSVEILRTICSDALP